ncbi:hypothetical protein TNCV_4836581 [Trichonephila clavipes]|nr:hypothetical protein TNCV_4836581 [Trichonephila clavipes]
MFVKSAEAQSTPIGVVRQLGEGMPAPVSLGNTDSKLRGLSPTVLVLICDATLKNSHSLLRITRLEREDYSDSRTDLHVEIGTTTRPVHRDVLLEQHVRLFRDALGAEFVFMDDNARSHRVNMVNEWYACFLLLLNRNRLRKGFTYIDSQREMRLRGRRKKNLF